MSGFLLLATGIFLNSALAATATCPRLEGSYRCPPTPTQAELDFDLVRTEEAGGVHRYTFTYPGYPDSTTLASPTGVLNESGSRRTWAYCINNELVYFSGDANSGWIQQSFLSSKREYVVKVRGQEFLRCSPRNPSE